MQPGKHRPPAALVDGFFNARLARDEFDDRVNVSFRAEEESRFLRTTVTYEELPRASAPE